MAEVLNTPAPVREGVPWFFEETPDPVEGAAWLCAQYAAASVLADAAGVDGGELKELVLAAAKALADIPLDASPADALDATVSAARTALARVRLGRN